MADLAHHRVGDVEPGVTPADLVTPEACDGVLDRLQAGIVAVERQLATVRPGSANEPPDWRANARAALRAKKFWLPRVQARRGELARQAKQGRQMAEVRTGIDRAAQKRKLLIGLAWATEPEAMACVEALARERHPDLFAEGGVA